MGEPYYGWAIDALQSLSWLASVDAGAFSGGQGPTGWDPRIIDVAHARWATSTAITAIDLCVAETAVKLCGVDFWSKRLPDAKEVMRQLRALSKICPSDAISSAIEWVEKLQSDNGHQALRRYARNPLTHSFVVRSAMIGGGRTPFEVDPAEPAESRPDPPALIARSTKLAEKHIAEFRRLIGPREEPPPPRPPSRSLDD
jgi:hypothetical protein